MFGNLIILPFSLAPLVFGQRFPLLMDCCGPLIYLLKMINLLVYWAKLESLQASSASETDSTESLSLKALLHNVNIYISLQYIFMDCFLISEAFYSRISNFLVYLKTLCVFFLIEDRDSGH